MDTLSERIKWLRTRMGLSQSAFAQEVRVSRGYISRVENGTLPANDRFVRLVCGRFGVSEAWLTRGRGAAFLSQDADARAAAFEEIARAFAPVLSGEEIVPLLRREQMRRMYAYLAYRAQADGMDEHALRALSHRFDSAFPGYEDAMRALEAGEAPSSCAYRLPVAGQAAAGQPLYSELSDEESVPVPPKYGSDRYFIVQAKGHSMEPALPNGGYVVVQRDAQPENGELALVQVSGWAGGEYAIKLFFRRDGEVELRSYNPAYPPMFFPVERILSAQRVAHIIEG